MTVTSNLIKNGSKPLLPLFSAWLFTLVGGYASAYAYIMLGGVFANMQTGNIIKCVIYAIEGREFAYLVYSVLAFVVGVVAAVVAGRFKAGNLVSVLIEIAVIGVCVLLAKNGDENALALNLLISFSCALQYEFFHTVGESGFTSVMCTNNLRLAVHNLTLGAIEKNAAKAREGLYFLSFMAFFIAGIAVGTLLSVKFGYYAVAFILIPLIAVLVLQVIMSVKRNVGTVD